MAVSSLQRELRKLSDPAIAEASQRFFKTGKGEYGEGDQFLGVRVPVIRSLASKQISMPLNEVVDVLHSSYHEERLLALLILVCQFDRRDAHRQQAIYEVYLNNTAHVNGWDLVDSSAYQIVGRHLFDKSRKILKSLARSKSLWERRISIIATYYFIKHDQYDDTLHIAKQLLADKEDLIHKATGWMLREVGNRNRAAEEDFLREHCSVMPRTMLRYAIEKFSDRDRQAYLKGNVPDRRLRNP